MKTLSLIRTLPRTYRFLASAFCCFLLGLLMTFSLPSFAFAASSSGYQFGQSQALDRASVSVVRVAVSYTPASCSPATGLGVIISSSPTPSTPNSFTNGVLMDGSLLVKACGTQESTAAQMRILASQAYSANALSTTFAQVSCQTSAPHMPICQSAGTTAPLLCQSAVLCSNGAVIIHFTSGAPLPFVDLSQVSGQSSQPPFDIGLTTDTGFSAQPRQVQDVVNAAQPALSLTPTAIISTNNAEPGTPTVDSQGHLLGMQIGPGSDTTDITQFVQASVNVSQRTSNTVHDAWNQAVTDYYQNAKNRVASDLGPIRTSNPQFQAPAALEQLAARSGVTATPTSSALRPAATPRANRQTALFGLPSNIVVFVGVAILVILALILLVITLIVWRRRAAIHRQQEEEMRRAEERANREVARIRQEEQAKAQAQAQGQAQPPAFTPVPIVQQSPVLQQSPAPLTCPNCGAQVKPDDNFCSQCRAVLTPSESGLHLRVVPPSPPAPTPSASVADMPTQEMSPAQMQQGMEQPPVPSEAERTQPRPPRPQPIPVPRHGRFVVATRSNRGYKRKYKPNEDSLFALVGCQTQNSPFQDLGLFVVADGMGGHANGRDASNLAIQTIRERIVPELQSGKPMHEEDYKQALNEGVQSANLAVHQRNMEQRADMGTTMTAALVVDTIAYIANVGDSRTYLYRPSEGLKKVTNDHSVVASLVTAGIINADDIYTHPKRNQIYRSLGEKPAVEVDIFTVPLQPGDILLLCCDGLWEMTRDPVIENILRTIPNLAQASQALIQAALDGGGDDNITVILAKVDVDEPGSAGTTGFEVLATPDEPQYPRMPNEPLD